MVMIGGQMPSSFAPFDPRILMRILLEKLQAPVG